MNILGTRIDDLNMSEAVARIGALLGKEGQHFVTTPNPEIILYAHRHDDYRTILNKADLALPDGFGLVFVSRIIGRPLKGRVSGADMIPEIAALARARDMKIAMIGGLDQATMQKAAATVRSWGNSVVYADYGVPKPNWNEAPFHEKMIQAIRAAAPQILFVACGHPKQEKWIDRYRSELPSVRLFIGCGGALDFIAGAAKRAPAWMRKAGLEWLWRLFCEPARIKRILNAVIVFPITVIYDAFRKK